MSALPQALQGTEDSGLPPLLLRGMSLRARPGTNSGSRIWGGQGNYMSLALVQVRPCRGVETAGGESDEN